MKFVVRPNLYLALTLLLVLAVYFQSISHPFSRFDDPFILEYYGNNSSLSLLDVITPGHGFYYRPLVNLSYWLDFRLWGLDPSFMHLENIIVHLVNVFLIYLLASRLPISTKIKSLPYLSALLFGLHPINSESINWIAGRTDVFAGMFILVAVLCLIRAIQDQCTRYAIIAFVSAVAGALTKETAIMFFPVAFMFTVYWPVASQSITNRAMGKRFILTSVMISSCLTCALLILAYVKRRSDNVFSVILEGGTDVLMKSLEAFGFYVKKIFLPLPLNVAIREVDPFYAMVGIVALCLIVASIRRPSMPVLFLLSAVLFTLPALVVASTSIAWTPFGERYLYIPSAFAVIGGLELFYRLLVRWNSVKLFIPIVSTVIAMASFATFQRGILWGNNIALIEDIVAKSPNFGVARNEYGALLVQEGRYQEAEKQFKIAADQNNQDSVNRIIRLNLIGVKIHGKPLSEARRILLSEIGSKLGGDPDLLKLLYKCDEGIIGGTIPVVDKNMIVANMIEINERLYVNTHDPFYLYRSGQLSLTIDDTKKAATFFKKVYENARPDAFYREPARKLADKFSLK